MIQRVEVIYAGDVHGVGFRFTARYVASRLGLCGFVKNIHDGTVLAVAEGEKKKLESFVGELTKEMSSYIRDSRVKWSSPTGEFSSFEIRF